MPFTTATPLLRLPLIRARERALLIPLLLPHCPHPVKILAPTLLSHRPYAREKVLSPIVLLYHHSRHIRSLPRLLSIAPGPGRLPLSSCIIVVNGLGRGVLLWPVWVRSQSNVSSSRISSHPIGLHPIALGLHPIAHFLLFVPRHTTQTTRPLVLLPMPPCLCLRLRLCVRIVVPTLPTLGPHTHRHHFYGGHVVAEMRTGEVKGVVGTIRG